MRFPNSQSSLLAPPRFCLFPLLLAGVFQQVDVASAQPPRISGPATFMVAEGETLVATLTATDDVTGTADLAWTIPSGSAGGADAGMFTLTSAGVLAFAEAKDFENADDTNTDGSYQVTVQVSDGALAETAALTVTLTNRNEAPTADAGADQADVGQSATVSLSGSGTDPDAGDTLTYAWTQTGSPSVTLSDTAVASPTFTAPADLTEDTTLSFTLRVTDAGGLYHEDAARVTLVSGTRLAAAPTLETATVDWTRLTLRFGQALAGDSVPPASAFAVLVGGTSRALAGVSVSGDSVVLALTLPVSPTDVVSVAYDAPADGGLEDEAGNATTSFAAVSAANATPARLATPGPGLGNLAYSRSESLEAVSWIRNIGPQPRQGEYYGTSLGTMLNGYFVVPFGRDKGKPGGGFLIYDVSDPRNIRLVRQIFDLEGDTGEFREVHSLPVARIGGSVYVAVQSVRGIEIWDFTDMDEIHRESRLRLPGVSGGDYSRVAWQLSWQAPYLYVAASSQGIYIVDVSDPAEPHVADRGHRRPNPVPPAEYGGFRVGPLFAMGSHLVVTSMASTDPWSSLDIGNPLLPVLLDTAAYTGSRNYYAACFNGRRVFATPGPDRGDMVASELSDPTSFVSVNTNLSLQGEHFYCGTQDQFLFQGAKSKFRKIDTSTDGRWRITATGTLDVQRPDAGQVAPMGNLLYVGNDHGSGSALFVHDTSPDLTPPEVVEVSPRNATVNQPLATSVGVAFTDTVLFNSVGTDSLRLVDGQGATVSGSYSVNLGIVSFSPAAALQPNTTYTVQVLAHGVSDYAGNRVEAAFSSTFTTTPELPVEPVHRWVLSSDAEDWFDRNDGTLVGAQFASEGGLRLDGNGDWIKLERSLSRVLSGDASLAFFLSTTQTGGVLSGDASLAFFLSTTQTGDAPGGRRE